MRRLVVEFGLVAGDFGVFGVVHCGKYLDCVENENEDSNDNRYERGGHCVEEVELPAPKVVFNFGRESDGTSDHKCNKCGAVGCTGEWNGATIGHDVGDDACKNVLRAVALGEPFEDFSH